MKFHEEIYTSAAELLDRSSGNLGIVARTKQFPAGLESELQSYRGYTILPQLPIDAVDRHPARFIVGPCRLGGQYYALTRVGFAGADHTGRTTPLAHHVVLDRQEMAAGGVAPAAAIAALKGQMYARWNEPPKWIDPPRDLARAQMPGTCLGLAPPLADPAVLRSMLAAAADALVQFPQTRRPLVVCLPLERAALAVDLIADILTLMPESLQHQVIATSHVVEPGDYLRDAWLLVSYCGSPFLQQSQQRRDALRPLELDFSQPSATPLAGDGYGKTILGLWLDADRAPVQTACKLWDQFGLQPKDTHVFSQLIGLRHGLRNFASAADVPRLGATMEDLRRALPQVRIPDEWSVDVIEKRMPRLAPAEIWKALAAIRADQRWPAPARDAAWKLISSQPLEGLPPLISLIKPGTTQETETRAALRVLLANHPALLAGSLKIATQDNNVTHMRLCVLLLSVGHLPFESAMSLAANLTKPGTDVNGELLAAVVEQLCHAPLNGEQIAALEKFGGNDLRGERWTMVALPVLQRQIATAEGDPFRRIANILIDASIKQGTVIEEAAGLIRRYRARLDASIAEDWKAKTAATRYESDMVDLLRRAGLIKPEQPAEPDPFAIQASDSGFSFGRWKRPVSRSSVWPILLPIVLSVIALGLAAFLFREMSKPLADWSLPWVERWSRDQISIAALIVVALGYWLIEISLQLLAGRSHRLTVPRLLRCTLTVALMAVIGYAAVPKVRAMLQERSKQKEPAAKSPSGSPTPAAAKAGK